ncbi:hypothetical protein ETB97_012865 [Aspergillus alliaceus]|uniref:Uncharacterized protein n=1 Tax=Petromyces alliaceus TaxID=209559 RepID=A0A8H6E6R6_PETAA|nr:hypothetical protein ETB97_012865 [Aspergillus burnettii]
MIVAAKFAKPGDGAEQQANGHNCAAPMFWVVPLGKYHCAWMPKLTTYEDNPFQVLITETNNDASRYENHRANRNAQQATQILAPDFTGWNLDTVLMCLDSPAREEGYISPPTAWSFGPGLLPWFGIL